SVDVVNVFTRPQTTTKLALHHKTVQLHSAPPTVFPNAPLNVATPVYPEAFFFLVVSPVVRPSACARAILACCSIWFEPLAAVWALVIRVFPVAAPPAIKKDIRRRVLCLRHL